MINTTMGNRIKLLRVQLGMSQPQLARKARVGQSTVSKYETDQVEEHRAHIVMKLSAALETLPEYLLTGKGVVNINDATSTVTELTDIYNSLSTSSKAMLLALAKTMK